MLTRYPFRGSNATNSCLPPFSKGGQLIKERICSSRSKFFTLRVDPISESLLRSRREKVILSQKVFAFVKMTGKNVNALIHFRNMYRIVIIHVFVFLCFFLQLMYQLQTYHILVLMGFQQEGHTQYVKQVIFQRKCQN